MEPLQDFHNRQNEFFELLKQRQLMPEEDIEALVYALDHILESVKEVYSKILPEIIDTLDAPRESIQERLWDVREEFRHIEYHIRDGKLTEL